MGVKVNVSGLMDFADLLGDVVESMPDTNKAFLEGEFAVFKEKAEGYTREKTGNLKGSFTAGEVRQDGAETSQDWENDAIYATWIDQGKRYDPRSGQMIYLKNSEPDYFWEKGYNAAEIGREKRYQDTLADKFKGG
ncbi:MAG: hypothetical protein FWG38_10235 [Defluviitaleaceae bacterium]|nr:hypothetical protein [Defluviitaleaceae bacterium]